MSFSASAGSTAPASELLNRGAISQELHQAAQPLTVLQGLLELALLTPSTTEEYRNVIQQAMEQAQKLSGCFDHFRELLHLQPQQHVTNFLPPAEPNLEIYENPRIERAHV
ncbi:MAG TPA: hypothetical protein VKR57_01005 [Terriglobales bacterium]|jgi:hypothetical protein|nr:hypothetical protein [Terriglobales bacterium]